MPPWGYPICHVRNSCSEVVTTHALNSAKHLLYIPSGTASPLHNVHASVQYDNCRSNNICYIIHPGLMHDRLMQHVQNMQHAWEVDGSGSIALWKQNNLPANEAPHWSLHCEWLVSILQDCLLSLWIVQRQSDNYMELHWHTGYIVWVTYACQKAVVNDGVLYSNFSPTVMLPYTDLPKEIVWLPPVPEVKSIE